MVPTVLTVMGKCWTLMLAKKSHKAITVMRVTGSALNETPHMVYMVLTLSTTAFNFLTLYQPERRKMRLN